MDVVRVFSLWAPCCQPHQVSVSASEVELRLCCFIEINLGPRVVVQCARSLAAPWTFWEYLLMHGSYHCTGDVARAAGCVPSTQVHVLGVLGF